MPLCSLMTDNGAAFIRYCGSGGERLNFQAEVKASKNVVLSLLE
jgi:Holliday junction resolvase